MYVGLNTHICFWDSNQDFIKGRIVTSLGEYFYNTENAVYVTVSLPNSIKDTAQFGVATLQIGDYYYPYTNGYIFTTVQIPAHRIVSDGQTTVTACLKLPSTYTASGSPTKICVICHGASAGIAQNTGWTVSNDYNNIVTALLNAGYAIMDCNGYSDIGLGYNHWNCPQAVAAYAKAFIKFTTMYNLEKTAYVYGFSMGGLTALTLGIEEFFPVKAVMIGCPVISIYQHCVVQNGNVPREDFLNAYELESWNDEAVRGYERYKDIITLDNTNYNFNIQKPLMIGYGSTDTNVSFDKISDYYNALKNANSQVILKEYLGGHEVCYGGSPDLIADMIRWFARF